MKAMKLFFTGRVASPRRPLLGIVADGWASRPYLGGGA